MKLIVQRLTIYRDNEATIVIATSDELLIATKRLDNKLMHAQGQRRRDPAT